MRLQNENTIKDVTPFLDQDTIRNDVARAPFCSKLDMSEAYEQTCIKPEDDPKTAFVTIYSTFVSRVMMMGDCNAPSTFQQLMTAIFRDIIGHYVHVYLDNIFIFSDTIEKHQEHL
jgi:Reverse transcriptase (RNA-dependent DNA polymerase)